MIIPMSEMRAYWKRLEDELLWQRMKEAVK